MKKIFIALALVLSIQAANAQSTKSPAAAKKALEAAEAAAANPKKAAKVATWLSLAKSYVDAYSAPQGNVWVGMTKTDLQLLGGPEKPSSVENVILNAAGYEKMVYADKNLYFNEQGALAIIEVTKPVVNDPLAGAIKAYASAAKADPKGTKTKDIKDGLQSIQKKYTDEGLSQYTLGNYAASSVCFEKAAEASATAPLSTFDAESVYYAGFTAYYAGDMARAQKFFEQCYQNKYYNEDGDVFAKLSEIYKKEGDADKSLAILKEGFQAFPTSQAILVSLINHYIESGDNQDELFSLINVAKQNEPNNPSLYYVEGNIYSQLGKEDEAIAAYYKSNEVDPKYENGLIGVGILYYNKAIAIAEEASNEFNDAKYMKLVEQFEEQFTKAIDPFEKAFAICQDPDIKVNLIAESLKNIYYRFRDKGADYQAAYDKYSDIVKNGL